MMFSIVVPTRNGMPFLRDCVDSVLNQRFTDFELVVSVNSSTDKTMQLLTGISDTRLRILETPRIMSMSLHWDYALRQARGEWTIVLGDDDGLIPGSLEKLSKIVRECGINELVSWRPGVFFWPGYLASGQWQAIALGRSSVKKVQSRRILKFCLLGILRFNNLPMIYCCSAWPRHLLNSLLEEKPAFKDLAPDIYSGVFACHHSKTYTYFDFPLSWVGLSLKSNSKNASYPDFETKMNFFDLNLRDGIHIPQVIGTHVYKLGYSSIFVLSAVLNAPGLKNNKADKFNAFSGALAESLIRSARNRFLPTFDSDLLSSPYLERGNWLQKFFAMSFALAILPVLLLRSIAVRGERVYTRIQARSEPRKHIFYTESGRGDQSLLGVNADLARVSWTTPAGY